MALLGEIRGFRSRLLHSKNQKEGKTFLLRFLGGIDLNRFKTLGNYSKADLFCENNLQCFEVSVLSPFVIVFIRSITLRIPFNPKFLFLLKIALFFIDVIFKKMKLRFCDSFTEIAGRVLGFFYKLLIFNVLLFFPEYVLDVFYLI